MILTPMHRLTLTALAFSIANSAAVPVRSRDAKLATTGKFLWLSDFHYDIYYGTPNATNAETGCNTTAGGYYGQANCDAPWSLVEASIQSAKDALPNPDFIIVTGDYTRHDTQLLADPEATVLEALKKVTGALDKFFPYVPRIHKPAPIQGNNDFPTNYGLNVTDPLTEKNPWLTAVGRIFERQLSAEELELFERGGYYMRSVAPGLYVILMNTVIYSPKHAPNTTDDDDPFLQFKWMRSMLDRVRSEDAAVFITGHIPPCLDSFGGKAQWAEQYIAEYLVLRIAKKRE